MSVSVQCPSCNVLVQVQDEHLGKQVKCGQCSEIFTATAEPEEVSEEDFLADDEELDFDIEFDGPGAAALEKETQELEEEEPEEPTLGTDPESIHGLYRLDIGSATSVGMVRERNEDSYLVQHLAWSNQETRREAALVVVADGMGGYEAGDRASKMTIQIVGSTLAPHLAGFMQNDQIPGEDFSSEAKIMEGIKSANSQVHQEGTTNPDCKGMGSTVAVLLAYDGKLEIGHVGDCRVYHFRDGNLTQVTKDQTLVARMVELGQLTEEEAESNPAANEVTQAIGKKADISPGYYKQDLKPGDWLIVACDGLHAHVNKSVLADTLAAAPSSAAQTAHYLVDLANFHGGTDNCTVVAVRCY